MNICDKSLCVDLSVWSYNDDTVFTQLDFYTIKYIAILYCVWIVVNFYNISFPCTEWHTSSVVVLIRISVGWWFSTCVYRVLRLVPCSSDVYNSSGWHTANLAGSHDQMVYSWKQKYDKCVLSDGIHAVQGLLHELWNSGEPHKIYLLCKHNFLQ